MATERGGWSRHDSPLLAPAGLADGFGLEEALPPKWFTPGAVVPRLPGDAPGIRHIGHKLRWVRIVVVNAR
ncbi:hypothetical protein GCM10023075_31130 [Streptosporangium album]